MLSKTFLDLDKHWKRLKRKEGIGGLGHCWAGTQAGIAGQHCTAGMPTARPLLQAPAALAVYAERKLNTKFIGKSREFKLFFVCFAAVTIE